MTDSHDCVDRGLPARNRMASFEKFFQYYWPRLVQFLKSQAVSTSMAEDVAAETMSVVWGRWDDLLTYDRPDSWTFKVAIRKLRRLEALDRELVILEKRALDTVTQVTTVDPEARAGANSEISITIGELNQLPRRQRQVLALALDGYKPAEIAGILGITANSVRVHLHHARSTVRSQLRSAGIPAA